MRKSFFEDGEKAGYERGKTNGEDRLGKLISMLLKENKLEEISLVSSDAEVRKEYYEKYHI